MKYGLSAKQVGERLKEYRLGEGDSFPFSIPQLARKAGMTETNWKEREKGKMDLRLSTFFRMLKALKVTPLEFFKGMKR